MAGLISSKSGRQTPMPLQFKNEEFMSDDITVDEAREFVTECVRDLYEKLDDIPEAIGEFTLEVLVEIATITDGKDIVFQASRNAFRRIKAELED
jgi:hypothetical protein